MIKLIIEVLDRHVFIPFLHVHYVPGRCTGRVCSPSARTNSTDIDTKSIESATNNIHLNNLESRIRIVTTIPEGPLLPLNLLQIERYPLLLAIKLTIRLDFCMCNPPFYTDAAELYEHASAKSLEPFSVLPLWDGS